jgi:hypothetical protein
MGAENRQYYRKTFDIYSLGIILLEIALWQPIHAIIGIANISNASPQATYQVRGKLLKNNGAALRRCGKTLVIGISRLSRIAS